MTKRSTYSTPWGLALLLIFTLSACGNKESGQAVSAIAECNSQTQAALRESTASQLGWYGAHGASPAEKNQALYFPGTNGRAVVLQHGFIANPASMRDLAEALNGRGFSVITPLMTGFGADPAAANASTETEWEGALADATRIAHHCHRDVTVIGHSLGGGIATRAVASGRVVADHLVLIAPYIRAEGDWLLRLVDYVPDQLNVIFFSDVERYLGIDPYAKFAFDRPGPDEQPLFVPLLCLRRMVVLAEEFANGTPDPSDVPVLAFASTSDGVIDPLFAKEFVTRRFRTADFELYPADPGFAHAIQSRRGNPRFDDMVYRIGAFLGES